MSLPAAHVRWYKGLVSPNGTDQINPCVGVPTWRCARPAGAPAARLRPGELVHAEQKVPAARRTAVFGAAADTFAGLGLAHSLAEHLEGACSPPASMWLSS